MTFEQMKEVVKDYCNVHSDEADLRIGRSLNRHYRRVTAKCGMDTARFVTRTETTTAGVQTVTFEEIEKIDRITDTTSGVSVLTEVSMERQRSITPGEGTPSTWAKQSTTARTFTVRLDVVPQDTYTLQADGWSTLSDLMGTDEPVFPESFHDILTWSVIAEELLKKEKDRLALKYETKAEALLAELQQHLADSYSQVTLQRNDDAQCGSTSGSGGSGSSTLGSTAYTQTALVTFDRGVGVDPFAVVSGASKVDNLDADKLDGEDGSYYLDRANHIGSSEVDVSNITPLTSDRLLGRDTAGVGSAEQLTVGGGIEFTGSGGIQRSALTGDVTASAGSTTTTIPSGTVTYAKMQDISATSRILGRKTSGSGDAEECTLSDVLDFIGSAAQGDVLYRGASSWARLSAGTSGQFLQTRGASANPQWAYAGIVDRDVAVATVANTAAETTVYSYTVPGGTLGSTRQLRLSLIGDQLQNFAGSDTLTVRVKYGATTIFTAAIAYGLDANRRSFKLTTELVALNATNAQIAYSGAEIGGLSSAAGTGVSVSTSQAATHTTIAEDSTADKSLVVTIQQQTADANISFRCLCVQTELL